jgi:hypothetical protein
MRGKKAEYVYVLPDSKEIRDYLDTWEKENRTRFTRNEWMNFGGLSNCPSTQWMGCDMGGTHQRLLCTWYRTQWDCCGTSPTEMILKIIDEIEKLKVAGIL